MADYHGVGKRQLFNLNLQITPASVAAATVAEQTFSLKGVIPSDVIDISPPGITAGVAPVSARCSAPDTIAVAFVNPTAGALTPAAGIYRIAVQRDQS